MKSYEKNCHRYAEKIKTVENISFRICRLQIQTKINKWSRGPV